MGRVIKLLMLSVATLGLLSSSLFIPKQVHSYEEMEAIPMGYPFPFWIQNMQRVTAVEFPQVYRLGNPWEDPWHIEWPVFSASFAVVFFSLLILKILVVFLLKQINHAILIKRKK